MTRPPCSWCTSALRTIPRALTIDAINAKAQAAFPGVEVQEAYTSRIIIRRLKERGITKLTPLDAMLKLRSEGYTHLIVQSTNIIDGVEMESLRQDVESALPFFKRNTCRYPCSTLSKMQRSGKYSGESLQRPAQSKKATKEHFVPMGHCTYTPSTAIYSQMDYMLKAGGLTNFHVGTIEGYQPLTPCWHN